MLQEALPQGFDFYHLGRIELEQSHSVDSENARHALATGHFGIGYRFEGELQGGLVLLVGEGLDPSIYSEAGNIIASRLATGLSSGQQLEVTVSPPHILRGHALELLLASGENTVRLYIHRQAGLAIPLQAVLLPATAFSQSPEATGNA